MGAKAFINRASMTAWRGPTPSRRALPLGSFVEEAGDEDAAAVAASEAAAEEENEEDGVDMALVRYCCGRPGRRFDDDVNNDNDKDVAEYEGCCGCGATIPVTPAVAPVARLLDTAPTPLVTRLLLPHVFLDEKAATNPDAVPINITIIVLNRIVRFISNPSTLNK